MGYVWCEICVGYVWCEIRQQSSEEPCDETSFGKKIKNQHEKFPNATKKWGLIEPSRWRSSGKVTDAPNGTLVYLRTFTIKI